jgi:regulator of protease activity HflC (stomatin/prohibitin superfamily)
MADTIVTEGREAPRDISQKPANVLLPWWVGLTALALSGVIAYWGVRMFVHGLYIGLISPLGALLAVIGGIAVLMSLFSFTMVAPYQKLVISLFGAYVGVDGKEGLGWMVPFYGSRTVSTALSNFETEVVKVNDRSGSPIDIAVVVVHRVVDAAKATYLVGNVDKFVRQQVIAGIRTVAASHDYDGLDSKAAEAAVSETTEKAAPEAHTFTLRGHIQEIAAELRDKAQEGLGDIGVELLEVRITHLAYAPEIAAAMLKRQQAQAVVAARETIVKGAVSIVNDTLELLKAKGMELDEDRRAMLTSNLLVVLSSDREASPVLPVAAA